MKVTFNTGNFSMTATGELVDEVKEKILADGLKYALQRDVATKVYIALAGVEGKKEDSRVLPKDFERDSVGFTTDNATAFSLEAEKQLAKLGTFSVSVTEYVGGESGSAMVRATNLVDAFLGQPTESAYRGILGGETASREELVELAHAMKLGIDSVKKGKGK